MSFLRTFAELSQLQTFDERFEYLSLKSIVGRATFGSERFLNQVFYTSKEWRDVRQEVIARDGGLDLAMAGHEIYNKVIIHHMNPITVQDVDQRNPDILDPELLITVSHETHNAIHYGDADRLSRPPVERQPGDTLPWFRKGGK